LFRPIEGVYLRLYPLYLVFLINRKKWVHHPMTPKWEIKMAKLQLSNTARTARGLPVVDVPEVMEPPEPPQEQPKEPAPEISKSTQRKLEQLLAAQEQRARNRQAIAARVDTMLLDDAKIRLPEVMAVITGINRDLIDYKKGVTDIPKMIESGLPPKEWAHRAGLARGYFLLERRLILIKLDANNKINI
jgi:hypothetical protein